MTLVEKVKKILEEGFPPPDKVILRKHGRTITGIVTSSRFKGLDGLDRSQFIKDILDSHLTARERIKVGYMGAVTPEEELFHLASPLNEARASKDAGRSK
jgi:acid stress-induced BolA-like protein IbaG/YrbA